MISGLRRAISIAFFGFAVHVVRKELRKNGISTALHSAPMRSTQARLRLLTHKSFFERIVVDANFYQRWRPPP